MLTSGKLSTCLAVFVTKSIFFTPPLTPRSVYRDSSALINSADVKETVIDETEIKVTESIVGKEEEIQEEANEPPTPPRSLSLKVEDYSEKSNPSLQSADNKSDDPPSEVSRDDAESQKSNAETSPEVDHVSEKTSAASKSKSEPSSPVGNGGLSPDAVSGSSGRRSLGERDVRTALAECIMPARHEDWEAIVTGLLETERMAMDATARAPASSWRAATRSASTHVRSLRSKVARAACTTLGALFEYRGRALDPELDEATGALLERCADVNRFLRADATSALRRIACGGVGARAAVALARRGVTHRAGPVRAAAAQALSALVRHNGASRILDMAAEPRTMLLRATGELLGDANAEARAHAKHLWVALADDSRFPQMLKEAMPPTRYRAIEKYVDKLRCR